MQFDIRENKFESRGVIKIKSQEVIVQVIGDLFFKKLICLGEKKEIEFSVQIGRIEKFVIVLRIEYIKFYLD